VEVQDEAAGQERALRYRPSEAPSKTRAAAFAILTGGVVAGVLDIIFAFIFSRET
jgi:hypothetical protein